MSLPHPHSKDPAQGPRWANPNLANGAGVQHPSFGDGDPSSYPKATQQGAPQRVGLVGSSQSGAVQVLGFWLGVGTLPQFLRTLSRPLKTAASCF